MRTLRRSFAIALAVGMHASAAEASDPSETLATHSLNSLDGTATRLADLRGEVLVVNFWATWCTPCRTELPLLDQWNREWAGRGARVVAVSIDKDVRRARRFAREIGLSLTVLHDGPGSLAVRLDLPSVPCTYLVGADGRIVRAIHTSSENELARLKRDVEALLATRKPRAMEAHALDTAPGADDDDVRGGDR